MIVEVEMRAFGGGKIRPVEIPDEYKDIPDEEVLDIVFYWGQNDFQPLPYPSVSVGDVVRLNGSLYACRSTGWEKINASENS